MNQYNFLMTGTKDTIEKYVKLQSSTVKVLMDSNNVPSIIINEMIRFSLNKGLIEVLGKSTNENHFQMVEIGLVTCTIIAEIFE